MSRKIATLFVLTSVLVGAAAPAHANLVDRVVGGVMKKIAAQKADRVFHAKGTAYEASFVDTKGTVMPAVVRLSRGGLPTRSDVLAMAIKVPSFHQDFLMISSRSDRGVGARLPKLSTTFDNKAFSSVTSFEYRGRKGVVTTETGSGMTFGLDGRATQHIEPLDLSTHFALKMPGKNGDQYLGYVVLHPAKALSIDESAKLKFTPVNDGMGVHPAGFINRLRRSAYEGSQAGRGV